MYSFKSFQNKKDNQKWGQTHTHAQIFIIDISDPYDIQ